jgi:hypothetical protein
MFSWYWRQSAGSALTWNGRCFSPCSADSWSAVRTGSETSGAETVSSVRWKGSRSITSTGHWRSMGEETDDQRNATAFSPRCVKDLEEEWMFHGQRHLFHGLVLVSFDATSLHFDDQRGDSLGPRSTGSESQNSFRLRSITAA